MLEIFNTVCYNGNVFILLWGKIMASIKDVAALAGVGVGTVSRVINGSVHTSEKVRKRVNDAIEQLNFHPNVSAQSLKSQKAGVVGLFIPVLNHPFFCAVAEKLEAELYNNGYKTLMVCSQGRKEKELMVLSMLAQKRVDGAVFITHYDLGKIDESLPLVTIDRHFGDTVPCITSDNYDSTSKAIELLIEKGCKKIAYFGGKPSVGSEVVKRYNAYKDVLAAHGMVEYGLFEEYEHGKDDEYAKKFMGLYGNEVDGVFCSGDVLANALYSIAVEQGISVPQKLKIISFDGIMRDWHISPQYTSVVQDLDEISRCVVAELINKIEGKPFNKTVVIPATLIEGETT